MHEKAMDNLDDVICFIKDKKIIFANKSIKKFGIEKEEAKGMEIFSLLPFLNKNGNIYNGKKWVSLNGRRYYIKIFSAPLEKNVSMIVIKDLTDFKDVENRLKEFKKMYEKIFDIAQEGIYIENEEGEIVFANNAFSQMIGYGREEIIGKRIGDFLEKEKKRRIGKGKYEIKAYTKNGYPKILISSYEKISSQIFTGGINFIIDATEIKRKEERLKILAERERNFRLKTAHYFFNPLAIAKGYMGLMTEELGESEKEKVLKAIHAIDRVENVIKNFVTRGEIAE